MPKAVRFDQLGGPEVLKIKDIPAAAPGPGELALDVHAVGLNRAESMYYRGFYMERPSLPSGLGYEPIGTVTAVGPDVDPSWIGKRVGTVPGYSMNKYPVLGEQAVVPLYEAAELPPALSVEEGAAVWMQYGTAYGALVALGKAGPGDFVLITAASSSVGLAAIQIARAQGAASIATTRTSAKKERLLALGADHVIATEEENLPARVRAITGGKLARIVFDPIGGEFMDVLGQSVADNGQIFLYGMLAGKPTPFPMAAFGRGVAMSGYSLVQMKAPAYFEAMKRYIYDRLADGTFQPKVDRVFPLDEAVEAYQYLEGNQQVGKIVIRV